MQGPFGPIVCKCSKCCSCHRYQWLIMKGGHSVAESVCYVGCTRIWDEISQRGNVGPLHESTVNNFLPAYFNC